MAWFPVSGLPPQFAKNAGGAAASGYWLKFYDDGTTTVTPMATDNTGGTTLTKCKLNTRGEPLSNSSDDDSVFIPYLSEKYKAVLYLTEADADANDTNSALWVVDDIELAAQVNIKGTPLDVSEFLSDLTVTDYAALLALTPAEHPAGTVVTVTDDGISGPHVVVGSTLASPDGGTTQSNATWFSAGKHLRRLYSGAVMASWFEVVGDGIADDSATMLAAWDAMLASDSKVLDTSGGYRYRLASAPTGTSATGVQVFFTTGEVDGVELRNGESTFYIDPPASQGESILFESKGTDGFTFDNIIGEVPSAKADAGDTTSLLHISYATKASSNTIGGSVRGKNTGGVRLSADLADYATYGFDSIYRPHNTTINEIVLDNTEMTFTLLNAYADYGLTCSCGGDDTYIGKIVTDTIHRGIFLYGVKNVTVASGRISESNATTVNIGSYGSCIDINIKVSVIQDTDLPTQLTRVQVYEVGTSGGGSLDLENSRVHVVSGIDLDLDISGAATTNETGFYLGKTTGDGTDSSIQIEDMNLSIHNTLVGVTRSFVIMADMASQNCQNVAVKGIVLNNCTVIANASIHLPPGMLDDIVVNKLIGQGSMVCTYGDITTTTPSDSYKVVLNNVDLLGSISSTGIYDCPVTVRDSRISKTVNTNGNVPAYNKTFINSYLGGQYIENKGRYDVYTHINDSSAMYSPDFPLNQLAAGGIVSGSNSTPLNLDMTAPVNTKTTIAASLYHDTFIGASAFHASNPYLVKILAQRSGSSGYGIATGRMIAFGVTAGDFTSATFSLEITSVINTGGQVFAAGDFSSSVVDADTIRFSCSRECAVMYVAVQRM